MKDIKKKEIKDQKKQTFNTQPPLKDIHEGQAGLLGELLVSQDFLQQRLFERLPGAAPQTLLPSGLGDHHPAQGALGRRPGNMQEGLEMRKYTHKLCSFFFHSFKGNYYTLYVKDEETPVVVVGELLQRVRLSFVLTV